MSSRRFDISPRDPLDVKSAVVAIKSPQLLSSGTNRPATIAFVGRNLFRSAFASMFLLMLVSGVMQLSASNVAAATKPEIAGKPCAPNDLRAIPVAGLAPTGTSYFLVVLENVSSSSCTLEGYPQLKMLDKSGKTIASRISHLAPSAGKNTTEVTLISVKPGWQGLFALSYPNSIGHPSASCPVSDRVEIRIRNMKESIVVKWRIRPYGGKPDTTPDCGQLRVSFVYGPYHLSKSQINGLAS
jgi:hypothetical protein